MASKQKLQKQLDQVQQLATTTAIGRFIASPIKYLWAIGYKKFVYPQKKVSKAVVATTFFGDTMALLLPASTDIYLTGGKSHDSEIRLARFLINQLQEGDLFFDIGAHYGYFSLLATKLVGTNGKVIALEAAPKTYAVLTKNVAQRPTIDALQMAVAETDKVISFYEFPNQYSEYNTIDIGQFEQQEWFQNEQFEKVEIQGVTIDQLVAKQQKTPNLIKIDVEGAEYQALLGAQQLLEQHSSTIIMEYLHAARNNEVHQQAAALLRKHKYSAFSIDDEGQLQACIDIHQFLNTKSLESDNIVFQKQASEG